MSPPPTQENLRDPAAQVEGADPGNAAVRKTAWNVPPPPPPAATGGIIGGDESWPALADSAARAWPKSASSDSLKSLSDGSAPSLPEELIVPVVPSQPVSNPISTNPNAASTSPPPNATAMASSRQSGRVNQPNLVRHGGGNGGNNGAGRGGNGSSPGLRTGNNTSDLNSGSGGDGNWNDGGLGGGSNLNSSVLSGGSNLNSSVRSGGINGSGMDSSRRMVGNNNWNGNGRGGGGGSSSNNNGTGIGNGGNRNNGSSAWNSNARNGSGISNGFGGRGGRNRRDHERGGSFPHRNYSRALPVPPQQQQPGYQPGPFHRPPPPPSAAHFIVSQPFMPYVPPFAYPDMQGYPFYITPVEQQFQNMHLVRQPMQPLGFQQDQLSLQNDIRHQIEHYFSTNNLCHDTYLRRHMDDLGWVPIDLIAGFPMLTRFTVLGIDTNYILDSIRGSEMLEVQGNNVRRRNDWADWLLHLPPANQLQ
ncbi:la-related protein 1B isoform X2 [Brachypodium distachyon]|uniref:la-related protein 1B isoform X2 n=1 Tax=Brachypodium distachyon TaxID=15368 RepID=UPI000D0D0637|nr:la-related protein 1B isoform X2 [Brachypodium distachyon]|eukprot:XP_024310807.1 la-related protein 1B isoform X2 [Brachypodium distachyon]